VNKNEGKGQGQGRDGRPRAFVSNGASRV